MAVRQYIGARYVPIFDGDWDITKDYEPLVIVSNAGNSYTSKTYVPHGVDITDTTYWACTGNYNAQVESYRQQVIALSDDVSDLDDKVDLIAGKTALHKDTVSAMSADTDLVPGDVVQTLGYHSINDGGGALYNITNTAPSGHYETVGVLYAELIAYSTINVKQLGAYGDGTHDDTLILQKAVDDYNAVYLPKGTYLISDNITINGRKKIFGASSGGHGGSSTILVNGAYGLVTTYNYIEIRNIVIENQVEGVGIGVLLDSDCHYITLEDVHINKCQYAIKNNQNVWGCYFNRVRMTRCTNGIILTRYSSTTNFALLFEECYFNRCTTDFKADATHARFICCNFGIDAVETISMDTVCGLIFDSCNFECDSKVGTGDIMTLYSGKAIFNACNFKIKGESTSHVIRTYSSLQLLKFEACTYTSLSGNDMASEKFIDPNSSAGHYGDIVYSKIAGVPEPDISSLATNVVPYFTIYAYGDCINMIGTNINTSNLKQGQFINQLNSSGVLQKKCYFNGTNVVDLAGNVIV